MSPNLPSMNPDRRLRVAVVGSGISALSCAWLLSRRHEVVLYEREDRLGGHSHTVEVRDDGEDPVPVDMGFIVFNEATYPNLIALFDHLGVQSRPTSFNRPWLWQNRRKDSAG